MSDTEDACEGSEGSSLVLLCREGEVTGISFKAYLEAATWICGGKREKADGMEGTESGKFNLALGPLRQYIAASKARAACSAVLYEPR